MRGSPEKVYSDCGSQLVAADKELRNTIKDLDQSRLFEFGANKGIKWEFTAPDGPWRNGCSEALIKSVKKAIKTAIGDQCLSFSELQTIFFEAANLVNERPIGLHPTNPEDGAYLSPNHLLLGRASSRVPSGPFKEPTNIKHRFRLLQQIVNTFWRRWTRDYFASLIIRQKWHTAHRNVQVGDVVIVGDSNAIRGNWRLARVTKTFPGEDGLVRKVELQYKNLCTNESPKQYKGKAYTTIERPVQRLIIIATADNKNMDDI